MACNMTRDDVSGIVIDTLNQLLDKENISEESEFDADLGLDSQAQSLLFFPIEKGVVRIGCQFTKFNAEVCGKAKMVGDIVDAICKDFGIDDSAV